MKFGPTTSEMIDRNGTKFNIVQKDRLYFFENVDLAHDETSQVNKVRSIQMWHKILGHCNVSDIMKMENICETEKFDCETCIMGKRKRSTKIMEMVHTD